MMNNDKIICDICGKEKSCVPFDISVYSHDERSISFYYGVRVPYKLMKTDCCKNCMASIINYFQDLMGGNNS